MAWLVGLLALLAGCGFHLRETSPLPPLMRQVCLEARGLSPDALADIRRELRRRGVRILVPCAADAVILVLRGEAGGRRVLSVDRYGRALEYEWRESLRFSLRRGRDRVLVPEQRIEAVRDQRFEATALLARGDEAEALRRGLRAALVDTLLHRVRAREAE